MNGNVELQTEALRARVSKLEGQVRFLLKHFDLTYVPGQDFELDPADQPVADALKKADLIRAIATYRSIHHVGLAEAKAAVEEINAGLGL